MAEKHKLTLKENIILCCFTLHPASTTVPSAPLIAAINFQA